MGNGKNLGITLKELVIILLLFILTRIVAQPWIRAMRVSFYEWTGFSERSPWVAIMYALGVTIFVIIFFIIIEFLGIYDGKCKDFLHK